ncbi:MAG: cytochrome b N-terminal domain-containing protein [Armatimonadetes bacterium]|nr:cytochrome b N-terminal domain-containing protein [Armatimonadota bacterium]
MSLQPIDSVARDDLYEPRSPYRRFLRQITIAQVRLERWLNELVSYEQNPFYFHGAIPTFVFWMLVLSGLGLLFYYKPTVNESYESLQYLGIVPFGGAIRSSHRYTADIMLIAVYLHILRVYITDRHRDYRIVPWLTGVGLLSLVYIAGISGYLLCGDERAWGLTYQIRAALRSVPLLGTGLDTFFLGGREISDFTVVRFLFFHIAAASLIFWMLWMHLLRIRRPFLVVTMGIGAAVIGLTLMVSGLWPALSFAPVANPLDPPAGYALGDWVFLPGFILLSLPAIGPTLFWGVTLVFFGLLLAVPYLLRDTRKNIAQVVRDKCVGCQLCAIDCPYAAIQMVPVWNERKNKPDLLAVVYPPRCSECGVCVGSCDFDAIELGSMPYARLEEMVRDLAPRRDAAAAEAAGD